MPPRALPNAVQRFGDEGVRRIARVLSRPVARIRLPIWSHTIAAWVFERTMVVPLVALA